ncbi:MAG: hypothetical protein IKI90_03325 [Treponema sp.]|nr:hypothetical protein [Treponema sp.]
MLQKYISENGIEDLVDSLEKAYHKTEVVEIPRLEMQALIKGMLLLVAVYNEAKNKDMTDKDFRDYLKTKVNTFFEE